MKPGDMGAIELGVKRSPVRIRPARPTKPLRLLKFSPRARDSVSVAATIRPLRAHQRGQTLDRFALHPRQDRRVVSIVTAIDACPSRSWTTLGCTPARSNAVTCACLSPLISVRGRPAAVAALMKALVIASGRHGRPSWSPKHQSPGFQAVPARSRSSAWATFNRRRAAVVPTSRSTTRRDATVFGPFTTGLPSTCVRARRTDSTAVSKLISDHCSPQSSDRFSPVMQATCHSAASRSDAVHSRNAVICSGAHTSSVTSRAGTFGLSAKSTGSHLVDPSVPPPSCSCGASPAND